MADGKAFSCKCCIVEAEMENPKPFMVANLFLLLITLLNLKFTCSKPTSFRLELIHRDSPKSPLYPGNLTFHERIQRYLKISNSRASYLMSLTSNSRKTVPNMMQPSVIGDSFIYLVPVNIGTPSINVLLLLDIGSSLIWTQCQPCETCFHQNYPLYDPAKSTSYQKIPCDNPLCKMTYECTGGDCRYEVHYGDKSVTKGIVSWETFNFLSPQGTKTNLNDILFGCSKSNQDFLFLQTGNVSGILGMNLHPNSFISQLGSFAGRRFSYCFVDPTKKNPPLSYLKFGDDIGYIGGPVQTTPFVKIPNSYSYGLNLSDISINNKRLNNPPDAFQVKSNGQGGVVIDSGTVLTFMQTDVYWKLHDEFVKYFAAFDVEKQEHCTVPVKLCYKMPSGFKSFPTMTYHFHGADLRLDPEQVFIISTADNFFLLAIAPIELEGKSFIGAWQQHDTEFIFDHNSNSLSFVRENCAG